MTILKELFSVLNEKKVGDDEYFIVVPDKMPGRKGRIDLYTEKAFKSIEAANAFIEKELRACDSLDAGEAGEEQADELRDADVMSGASLKKQYPKLFEGRAVPAKVSAARALGMKNAAKGNPKTVTDTCPFEKGTAQYRAYWDGVKEHSRANPQVDESADLAKQLVRGEKGPKGLMAKLDSWLSNLIVDKDANRFLPAERAVKALESYGFSKTQVHSIREAAAEAAQTAIARMQKKHGDAVPDKYLSKMGSSFAVFDLYLNVSEDIHKEFAALMRSLFDAKIDKMKDDLDLPKVAIAKAFTATMRGDHKAAKRSFDAYDVREDKELDDDCVSRQCHAQASAKSKKDGVVQHINKDKRTGKLYVSDWFDDDETVATYNKGKLSEGTTVTEAFTMDDVAVGGTVIYKTSRGYYKMSKLKSKREPYTLLLQSGDTIQNSAVVSTDASDWSSYKDKKIVKEARSIAYDVREEQELNEFAKTPRGDDNDEQFSKGLAKMAKDEGVSKGVSLNDTATLERAFKITHWDTSHGGLYKQYFADGWKEGRENKIAHDKKQYGMNAKLQADGSIKQLGKVNEARSIPAWFKDGAKVKLMPEYADKDPDEVFALVSVDTETGKGRISDDQGKGWGISYYQVYPKNRTPAIHESTEGNLTFTPKDDGKVGRFGVKVGQIYVPADGSKNELKVLRINHATEDALVFDKAQNKERHIDLFKLARVRYSLKEDAALQGLGKSLSGKAPAEKPTDGVDVPMGDEVTEPTDKATPTDTEVTSDDQEPSAEFKVGDVVKTLVGPHKGEEHDVVKVHADGRVDLKPKGLEGTAVKYRNGGVTAKPEQVVLAESIIRGTKSLLRTITIDITEGKNDTMMPLSYKPAKGHKIEAYGRKGMKNTMWRKYFKDGDAMAKWCDENDATVEGSRDLDKDELR